MQRMAEALDLARYGLAQGEVPVGALIEHNGTIIGKGWNQCIGCHDPSLHAEMVAIRAAAKHMGNYRLNGCTLYVTLEPCMMCVGTIAHARLDKVVFGAYDPKSGALGGCLDLANLSLHHHHFEHQGGVMQQACSEILSKFFQMKRTSG